VDQEEVHNLHFMSNNIRIIKSSRKIWIQHVACIWGKLWQNSGCKQKRKRQLERLRFRLQSNINRDLKLRQRGLCSSGTEDQERCGVNTV